MMIGIGIPRSQRRMPLPIAASCSKSGVKTTSTGFAFPLIRHSRAMPPATAPDQSSADRLIWPIGFSKDLVVRMGLHTRRFVPILGLQQQHNGRSPRSEKKDWENARLYWLPR